MLEIVTNVQGEMMDHDDWTRLKASQHETPKGNQLRGQLATEEQLPTSKPVKRNKDLETAVENDLKVRGVSKKSRN